MKILAVSHVFPPAIDGGSKVIYQLSHQLEKQGNQVIYLSSDCFSTDDFTKKSSSIYQQSQGKFRLPVYHHLRRPLKFINLFLPKKSYLWGLNKVLQKGPIFRLLPFLRITTKIIKFKPDLIIAGPLPTTIILYANFFKKITHAKLLINSSFHQSDPNFHRLSLIKTLKSADFLWTLTQYESKYFINKLKINPQKIILAGNGVETTFLKQSKTKNNPASKNKTKILFIGSLAAHKRIDLLLKSFSDLIKKKNNLELIIIGQKTLYYPQIQKTYNSLKPRTKSKIKFKFNLKNQTELIENIDSSDLLVLPSIQESFGLVLIEAWARKKAVITSNIPPLKELVNLSKGGLTFKKNNLTDMKKNISKLISQPKLRQQLAKNGQSYVKNNYTWKKVSQKICQKISPSL